MKHHTKTKGDIGVGAVIADLLIKGITPCLPVSEHQEYDLVGCNEFGCKRIQVKARTISKQGTLSVRSIANWSDRFGCHRRFVDKSTFDLYAIYCLDNGEIYYLNPYEFDKAISIRVRPAKNNQSSLVRLASDYTEYPKGP